MLTSTECSPLLSTKNLFVFFFLVIIYNSLQLWLFLAQNKFVQGWSMASLDFFFVVAEIKDCGLLKDVGVHAGKEARFCQDVRRGHTEGAKLEREVRPSDRVNFKRLRKRAGTLWHDESGTQSRRKGLRRGDSAWIFSQVLFLDDHLELNWVPTFAWLRSCQRLLTSLLQREHQPCSFATERKRDAGDITEQVVVWQKRMQS